MACASPTLSAITTLISIFSIMRRDSDDAAIQIMAISPNVSNARVTLTPVVVCAAQLDIFTSFCGFIILVFPFGPTRGPTSGAKIIHFFPKVK